MQRDHVLKVGPFVAKLVNVSRFCTVFQIILLNEILVKDSYLTIGSLNCTIGM